jgi:Calcineurin-like phosphoesterase
MTSAFDIIGDVHGQFDKLVGLLSRIGYRDTGGTWRHPSRSVIFVGDLIDRGPKQLATVDLVRAMVEAGARMAIVFRDAVKPSMAAAGETPVSHAPENKHPSACGCTVRARHAKLLRWLRDLDCHREVATDGVRKASRSHASDSPLPGETRMLEQPGQTEKLRGCGWRGVGRQRNRVLAVPRDALADGEYFLAGLRHLLGWTIDLDPHNLGFTLDHRADIG